ncbi:organic hydroperoxide resistance protein [Actinoalloteichus hymeniacidonis]|uniref:Peroxiredoxin, Ohr subfamily n=1 Tax=Actinoalloteichus hymeniacidonis TaxID=340345 RepID=A0AAC9HKU2_9PSEU|nr:organic hydroperoxide resistance protein [Actinoalloteichus hymeniacidonis]AOS61075.1 peroxiredoxin, Ohr subfamily [Actinoalloteichus hymeniacidonis]MBB5910925.1 Ohr subfamily peroxiredoxin [Actinoalloteichus hymeniacidonis]
MTPLYTAEAVSTGQGRDGEVRSSDGVINEQLATPTELGGPGGAATNPEQLFAAGYSACFHSAVRAAAARSGTPVRRSEVTAKVGIGADESDGGFRLSVDLEVRIPELTQPQANEIVEAAQQLCPYSKATRGNIDVSVSAVV